MVEIRATHGVKRKLSDGDCELRCHQRQTVFNISLCKLQRNSCASEPVLCRTVLIANTVKLIEREIEEERKICGEPEFGCVSNEQTVCRTVLARPERTASIELDVNPCHTPSRQSNDSSSKLVDFEFELGMLGEKIAEELEFQVHRLGESGDRQRTLNNFTSEENRSFTLDSSTKKLDQTRAAEASYRQDFERDLIAASNLLGLELNEEVVFSDVDVSLYDFDLGTSTLPVEIEELCANAFNICHSVSRCGESLKLERASEHLFDDLDQVMQILVGS